MMLMKLTMKMRHPNFAKLCPGVDWILKESFPLEMKGTM